jgi:hypothetical protein
MKKKRTILALDCFLHAVHMFLAAVNKLRKNFSRATIDQKGGKIGNPTIHCGKCIS